MKRSHVLRMTVLLFASAFVLASLAGCESSLFTQYEQWDHVMADAEFTDHPTLACMVYRYEDARFNTVDLFDMYMVTDEGVSDFDSVYDETLGVFLYQPVYSDGAVTWLAHPGANGSLAGETLRFYRIWK